MDGGNLLSFIYLCSAYNKCYSTWAWLILNGNFNLLITLACEIACFRFVGFHCFTQYNILSFNLVASVLDFSIYNLDVFLYSHSYFSCQFCLPYLLLQQHHLFFFFLYFLTYWYAGGWVRRGEGAGHTAVMCIYIWDGHLIKKIVLRTILGHPDQGVRPFHHQTFACHSAICCLFVYVLLQNTLHMSVIIAYIYIYYLSKISSYKFHLL